jgi:glycosyltransferase involved in cell wall biosynthesis
MTLKKLNSRGAGGPVRVLQMCAVDFTARQFLQPLTAALEVEGYAVAMACARGPWFEELEAKGFRMVENPVSRSANVIEHGRSLWRTYRLLRREKIDVLHVHTPIAALVGRLAGWLARTPVIIYTAHGFYFHENSRPMTKRALVLLEKIGSACGDYIMCVSDEDRQAAISLGIARPEQVETIYNGVDTAHYDPARFSEEQRAAIRAQSGIPPGAKVIGIMGRLVREKGFFEFFEAAAQVLKAHGDCWFMVVGDLLPSDYDGRRDELKLHVERMGVAGRTVFTGMVDDPAPPLSAMDIFCLPSYREGMPISLLEAMSMALPCVATDIRGCREEVVQGETGWLVPAKDAGALAERILWLLDHPGHASEMGAAGRRRVLELFDIRRVVDHQLEIYRRLVMGATRK